jgi:hypothetical protein
MKIHLMRYVFAFFFVGSFVWIFRFGQLFVFLSFFFRKQHGIALIRCYLLVRIRRRQCWIRANISNTNFPSGELKTSAGLSAVDGRRWWRYWTNLRRTNQPECCHEGEIHFFDLARLVDCGLLCTSLVEKF